MEQFTQYIKPDYMVLVGALYCIGCMLRTSERFPNRFIPLTLTACGLLLAGLSVVSRYAQYENWAAAVFEGVVQGILCTGMAVYINEMVSHRGGVYKKDALSPPKTHADDQNLHPPAP